MLIGLVVLVGGRPTYPWPQGCGEKLLKLAEAKTCIPVDISAEKRERIEGMISVAMHWEA